MQDSDIHVIRHGKTGKYLVGSPDKLAEEINSTPEMVEDLVFQDRTMLNGWLYSPKPPDEAIRISGRPKIKDQIYRLVNFDGCILEGKPEALANTLKCATSTIYNLVSGRREKAKGFRVIDN